MIKRKKKNNYVNNEDLLAALIKYNQDLTMNPQARAPDYIGKAILLICTRLSTAPNFNNYSYKEEMIGDAIEKCCAAITKFDITRSNPFSYFTQIAYFAFINRIQVEKKETVKKHKFFLSKYSPHDIMEHMDGLLDDRTSPGASSNFDISHEIIATYEAAIEAKKKKKENE